MRILSFILTAIFCFQALSTPDNGNEIGSMAMVHVGSEMATCTVETILMGSGTGKESVILPTEVGCCYPVRLRLAVAEWGIVMY